MKKNNLFKLTHIAWIMLLSLAVITTSCKKDDDDDGGTDPGVIVLDGTYIKGAGTALVDFDTKGKMAIAKNEVTQEDRAELTELYVAIKGGSEGFNIIVVDGGTQTVYGPGADFAMVPEAELDGEAPNLGLYRGSITESATPFTVTEDGLYHIAYDSELGVVTVAKVVWGVIGAATPGGWSTSTQLAATFDLNEMVFEGTGIEMALNEFKFRYSNGWKVILSSDFDFGDTDGKLGIKVNTNFGGALDALVAGGGNITPDNAGIYTIKVIWKLGEGTVAELTKTGDLDVSDWTNVKFDVFGTGVDETQDGAIADPSVWNWGYAMTSDNDGQPTIDGDVASGAKFTYTWSGVSILNANDEGFAFRSVDGTEYNGNVLRYSVLDKVNSDMTAIDSTINGFGDVNINAIEDGLFDVTLTIDAANEDAATAVIVKHGTVVVTPELYMLGNATAAGWDNAIAIPLNGTGGLYTLTADLVAGEMKFISVLGQWQPQYGMGANPGELAVNDGTGDDPAAIVIDAAGSYNITVNTNDMTYTVVAAK